MKEYYKITEVARLYGLCTDTLRYYEEQGLLHPHRSETGYRLYSIDDICNLNVIRALRELDMPVEHMRRYFGERTVASTLDMLDEQDAAILLRRLARRIAKGDWAAYLDTAGDGSFEEVMLQGMVIGAICAPPQEVLARTAAFVPKIDNWSVCDSFCSGLKLARTHPEPVWEFLQPYFEDPRPFAVRFAVVMLLFYYIDAQHLPRVLALLEKYTATNTM